MSVELVPGGAGVAVTAGNAAQYVALASRRRLLRGLVDDDGDGTSSAGGGGGNGNAATGPGGGGYGVAALRAGLEDVVPPCLLAVFSAREVMEAVGGPQVVDVAAWRAATSYPSRGLTGPGHPLARKFWDAVEQDLSEAERRALLTFWSGSPAAPAFGTGQDGRGGVEEVWRSDAEEWTLEALPKGDVARGCDPDQWCPEASTCDRTLRLPAYSSKQALLKALRVALAHGAVGYDRA
jgi:hypothetical protein